MADTAGLAITNLHFDQEPINDPCFDTKNKFLRKCYKAFNASRIYESKGRKKDLQFKGSNKQLDHCASRFMYTTDVTDISTAPSAT